MRHRWWSVLGTSLAIAACGGGGETVQPDDSAGGTGQPSTLLKLSGITGAKGSLARHTFAVPAGSLSLAVATEGGTGNVDIAVLGPGARDCESASAGNTERCDLASPVAGGWQVGLLGTDDYSDVSLTVTVMVPGLPPPAADADPPAPPPVAPEPTPAPPAEPPPVTSPPVAPPPVTPPQEPVPSPATPPQQPAPPPVTPPPPPAPSENPPPVVEPPPVSGGESPPPSATTGITLLHADAVLPAGFVAAGNRVFFVAGTGHSSARRLWISDGSPAGTRRLHDALQPAALTAVANGVAFTARNPESNQHALWHASATGTVRMLRAFKAQGGAPSLVGVFGTRLYFIADDDATGRELWSTDGTSAGTRLVADIDPNGDARFEATRSWAWFNGRLYFIAARGRREAAQLYATNGNAGDLQQLTFGSVEPRDLSGHDMAVLGNRLYFTWHSRDDGVELWRTDGSVAGTQPFFDSLPGRDRSGSPRNFNVVGGRLLFFAYNPGSRTRELFTTNGSASGTVKIADVEMSTDVPRMVQVNGRHLFPGRRQWDGAFTLWATDGSATGTVELGTQVNPAAARFDAGAGTARLGNRLVFLGRDSAGYEPWVTDGTRDGTRRLGDLNPGPGSSFDPRHDQGWIAAHDGKAYFTAAVASDDFRFFHTDGTAQGTQELAPADASVRENTRGDGRAPLPAPFASGDRLLFPARFHTPGAAVLFGL